MTKTFKILSKEPYKFKSKDGRVFDKCRYQTDSDVLDLFTLGLEIGKSYEFEEQEKEFNGKVYKNWVLAKPKSPFELRLESLEKRVTALEGREMETDLKDIPFN